MHPLVSVALGTMTATFGGVIRDILCNEIPIIFRKEIYASACIIGALGFIGLQQVEISMNWRYGITVLIVIIIRIIAIKRQLTLPIIAAKELPK